MQACTRLAGLVLAFAVCLCAAPSAALECGAREDAELASHRRIGWQDFQATPPARPGRSGGAEVVVAQIRLLVRVDALSVRTEQRADGTWVARGVPCVRAYLVKRRSGRLPSARFAWQLGHEQRHFDLAQVYAQRLRDRVLGLELAGRTEAEAERGLRAPPGARIGSSPSHTRERSDATTGRRITDGAGFLTRAGSPSCGKGMGPIRRPSSRARRRRDDTGNERAARPEHSLGAAPAVSCAHLEHGETHMGRWSRQELEDAVQHYRDTARKSATSGDWTHWSNLFTEDVTYNEHHFGKFSGKDAVHRWISSIMSNYPMNHMIYFPWTWYVIDEERGWVICELMNRMKDPGDGTLHEEPNITILHYAGNNRWSYEEDAYDFENVARMIARWQEAKERCDALLAQGRDPRQERHLSRFGSVEIAK